MLSFIVGDSELAQRIRAHPWRETELGPPETWPESLKTLVSVMLAAKQQMYVVWGPGRILLYNDRYIEVLQGHHPNALGRNFLDAWSEIAGDLRPLVENAYAGIPTYMDDILLLLERKGYTEETHFAYSYTPVYNASGEVDGFFCSCIETTEQVKAARAIRENEERLRRVLDGMGEGFGLLAPDFTVLEHNREALRMDGRTREEIVGRSHWDVFPGSEHSELGRLLKHAMATREPVSLEHRYAWNGDRGLWLEMRAYPTCDGALAVFWRDVTDRREAQEALREGEARFQQFAAASSGALWIRNADTLEMEYASPAIAAIYGVDPAELFDGVENWAARILPEDRDIAFEHVEGARRGEAVVHEFRIQRASDLSFRWIRDIGFPLRDEQGRIQRIGGIAEDVTDARAAIEHQGVLLAELQHRVRNIMAMLQSVVRRTADGVTTVEEYAALLSGRIAALARTQALLTRRANIGVGLMEIVSDEMAAHPGRDGQVEISGPDVILPPKAAEIMALAVHELAINALKYGALKYGVLSDDAGRVRIRWKVQPQGGALQLSFRWVEQWARQPLTPPKRRGFGTELIEQRVPYELRGRGRLVIAPDGAQCELDFPLASGASVLETGAPVPATVFGGAIDMTGEPALSGANILVLEDDFYLASDTARALRGAGANVIGPFAREDDALAALEETPVNAAVVDINLGAGATFVVPHALAACDIPYVFVTGYDHSVIPPPFADAPRLQKPLPFRELVRLLAPVLRDKAIR